MWMKTRLGVEFRIDKEDASRVAVISWQLDRGGYLHGLVNGRLISMHRFVLGLTYKDGTEVDHANGDSLDNRKSNLRLCSKSQNAANRRRRPMGASSQYKGVTWNKRCKKWQASLKCDGKSHYLGLFHNEQEAAAAYDSKAIEVFGKFAAINARGRH